MKAVVQPHPLEVRPYWRWGMVCLAVLNVRWFLPTEATADGATLWLAMFWCIAAAVTAWMTIAADPIARRWTRADSAVALLVGGHVLSGALVLVNGGQRQLAANLIGEWLGIAAVWSIVRDFGRIPWFRAALWQSTLMSLVLLGAYGCWQHWYELSEMAHRLGPKFDAIRAARAGGGTDPAEQELSQQGVPLTEPEFTLFEKRLRDSREPFAFFALANTLGGFLAAGLMLLLADFLWRPMKSPDANRATRAVVTIAVCLLAGGLLLTKSRTAWVALALIEGFAVALRWCRGRATEAWSRRAFGMVMSTALAFVVITTLLLRYGSWDREVLAEAPKSLLYRWQYWTGTARLIAEQPLLGGGLGQFRTDYLRVKEPAASEEIADPHNFLLDVWYNGGLLALAGAAWLIITLIMTCLKASRLDAVADNHHAAFSWELVAAATAPWLAFGAQLYGDGYWDDRLLVVGALLVAWATIAASGRALLPHPSPMACGLTALVLCTHLLGAGGIGYAAVLQFILLLLAGTMSPVTDSEVVPTHPAWTWGRRGGYAVVALIAFLLWNPTYRSLLDEADALAARGAPNATVREAYRRAKSENPWDPAPCARLAEFAYREIQERAAKTGRSDIADILEFTREWLPATRRDPANGVWWHRVAEMEMAWHIRHPDPELARQTQAHLQKAVQRYPTNARWQADLSDAADAAGDTDLASRSAAAALAQDEINQRFGHVERILAGDVRARLSARVVSPE